MRKDIKFRGKRTDNGEWVYGDLIRRKDSFGDIVIIGSYKPDYFYDEHQVDPSTVGQFAGLKDRNGKEVYFKDIVKDPSGNYFVVEWYEQEMRIVLKRQDVLYGFNVPLYEVVGNVFENPELL